METLASGHSIEREPRSREFRSRARACAADKTRLTEAVHWSRLAVEAEPDNARYLAFLGRDLIEAGNLHAGVDALRRAADMEPQDSALRASTLWYLNYLPDWGPESIARLYQQWGHDVAPEPARPVTHRCDLDPQRRLRVGYVSPDFCRHSVAYYVEPILDGHDHTVVEVFGYGHVPSPDQVTARLQSKFDYYRDLRGLTTPQMAATMRADRLDILVALAGHCIGNCLPALVERPAPIQVDLGSITTTGLTQIDYRISDEVVDPPANQAWITEKLVYLPGGWSTFAPPVVSPPLSALPALTRDHVTFGSFNNHIKINAVVLGLWARILLGCPGARLVIKCPAAMDIGVQQTYRQAFVERGVAPDRIDFCGELPYYKHLERLGQVDLALDSFPFNGGMTTLEGLWMGVPIVTLTGQTCVSRTGRSILRRLGLDIFTADSPDEYVAKAVSFASQPQALAEIRQALRGRMLNSPLCDPGRMAGELESAYRTMWQHYVGSQTEGGHA